MAWFPPPTWAVKRPPDSKLFYFESSVTDRRWWFLLTKSEAKITSEAVEMEELIFQADTIHLRRARLCATSQLGPWLVAEDERDWLMLAFDAATT